MRARENSEDIEAAAAAWVARQEGGEASSADVAQLDAWLKGDTRRQGAYVRARAAWELLNCGRALAGVEPAVAQHSGLTRRALLTGSFAVATAAAVGILVPHLRGRASQRLESAFGEVREVALDDGSTVFLDTETVVEVQLLPGSRRIRLVQGQAWFKVAKDASRPFLVRRGPVEVQAVGTAFSVNGRGAGTAVLVTEGVVELSSTNRQHPAAIRLQSGTRALMQTDGRARIEPFAEDAIERTLAWREGRIGLNGETLLEAAQSFNRYNTIKIAVDDVQLGTERLIGWFDIKDPIGFAEAVETSLGAIAQLREGTVHLAPRPRAQ